MALLALSAMVFAQPVAADDCSVAVDEDPVLVKEGEYAMFRIEVRCDTKGWTWTTFRYLFDTADDSAKSPEDYNSVTAGAHVFYAGTGNSTAKRSAGIKVLADDECEGDEEFKLEYRLQGQTHSGWVDWSGGIGGLPGTFSISSRIEDQTAGCQ